MSKSMYYTPKNAIPAFKMERKTNGKVVVEFKNNRTGKTEQVEAEELVNVLQDKKNPKAK